MTATTDTSTVLVDHAVGPEGRLTVRLAAAQLHLVASATDRIMVRSNGGRTPPDRLVIDALEGELQIREKERFGVTFDRGGRTVALEIALPVNAHVAIDLASGDVEASGLRNDQRYRTASGSVRATRAAGHIELTTVSGDAILDLGDRADLVVRTVSGDIGVDGGALTSLRVSTTSGDVRVSSPL